MAVRINADTVVGGAVVTADATGIMELQSGGSTKLTLNSSGVTLASALPIASGGTNGTATPTANGVVYGTGTTIAYTAAGTTGQVLTATTSSAPTWATPATGAMTLISTQTASASASLNFTGLSTYTRYMLLLENIIPATSNVQTRLQIGTGATPTYVTSAYSVGTTSYEGGANGFIIASGNNSYANGGINATITLMAPVAGYPGYLVTSAFFDNSGETLAKYAAGGGRYTSTATVTAFRLIMESGNITSGKATLYGISS